MVIYKILIYKKEDRLLENNELDSYIPTVKLTTKGDEKSISLEVFDNGTGMDEDTAIKAFDPLFTTRARGTGLGLSIVKKIIEEHGEEVVLKSKIHYFTKVIVTFPLTP